MTIPTELEAAVEMEDVIRSQLEVAEALEMAAREHGSVTAGENARNIRAMVHALSEANERASILQTAVHERTAERDEALKECARYAREAGFATGKLEMSEAAGIVDGWKERTEAAESALAASEARRGELENVLGWYGENARLCRLIHSEGNAGRHALAEDGGKRAATILQKSGEA